MNEPTWHGTALVRGEAIGMGSKRIGRIGGKPVILDDKDVALRTFQQGLIWAMRQTAPRTLPERVPVEMSISVYVPRPKDHFGTGRNAGKLKPSAPPRPAAGRDIDKLARAILDAGKYAGWYRDDQQLAALHVSRYYAETPAEVRTEVEGWLLVVEPAEEAGR